MLVEVLLHTITDGYTYNTIYKMRHIRQINTVGQEYYGIVIAQEPLENHISITKYLNLFEISDDEIPEKYQYLNMPDFEVPQEVQLWRIRTVLKLSQLETQIETAMEQLPEPAKTGAKYIWQFGTTVERSSQTVLMLQQVLGMTNEQLDEMFIQADAIVI